MNQSVPLVPLFPDYRGQHRRKFEASEVVHVRQELIPSSLRRAMHDSMSLISGRAMELLLHRDHREDTSN